MTPPTCWMEKCGHNTVKKIVLHNLLQSNFHLLLRKMKRKEGKSSIDDYVKMINCFRISELQILLGSCGRSQYGRKHELHGRAKTLLKSAEDPAIQDRAKSKVVELYNRRLMNGATPPTNDKGKNAQKPTDPPNMPTSYLHTVSYVPYSNDKSKSRSESRYVIQSNYQRQYNTNQPPLAKTYKPYERSANATPVHPDVQFISLPFYEVVDVLIKPTSLTQKTMMGYQETHLVFHLTPYQTHYITNSSTYHIKSMIESAVQVQIRFCLNETSCVQEDLYPTRCKIAVNGKGTPLPGQPPPNAQNQEPKKPHRPVNITSFCHISPMEANQIKVQWLPSDLGQHYTATVHLVKAIQADTLIQKLVKKTVRSKEYTIGFIKEKLSPDPDSEIAMTSLKVSLCCPIGRTRMSMPCRANNCNHLQCFDGSTYIQMNELKPSWLCPICDQKAYYKDLFQDELFTSIIAEATNCEDIVFFQDGSWRPLEDFQEEQDCSKQLAEVINTPKSSNTAQSDTVCDTSVLSIATPEISITSNSSPQLAPNIRPMPSLDLRPRTQEDLNTGSEQNVEEDIEVIMIDSDSDSEDTVPDKTNKSSDDNDQWLNSAGGIVTNLTLPFSDSDLEDLQYLLPQEANINNPQQSLDNSIIDICDE